MILILITGGFISSYAQDSIKIKNRRDKPDTSVKDTVKLKGGALIDTINIKDKTDPFSDTTSYFSDSKNVYAFQNTRAEKIEALELQIANLKGSMKGSVAEKSAIASIENKKNDLKSRIQNEAAFSKIEQQKWDQDYSELMSKIEELKAR
jgi:hypothetical protein